MHPLEVEVDKFAPQLQFQLFRGALATYKPAVEGPRAYPVTLPDVADQLFLVREAEGQIDHGPTLLVGEYRQPDEGSQ